MILRLGIAMMACSLFLAAVVAVNLAWDVEETPIRSVAATVSEPVTDLPDAESTFTPERLKADPKPVPEAKKPTPTEETPIQQEAWPEAKPAELEAESKPRKFKLAPGAAMSLTIKDVELYDAPVYDEESKEALDKGVIHIPETPMPTDDASVKNVYLAGHRLGYEGTAARMIFYELPSLVKGDEILLRDRNGTKHTYSVSEKFVVPPNETWPIQPVENRDILTLQTCTGLDYSQRLIVRADRSKTAGL